MITRIVLSVVAAMAYGALRFTMNGAAPLISGDAAGRQFDNSDVSHFGAQAGLLFNGNGVLELALLVAVLAAIWWRPLRSAFFPAVALLLGCSSAQAYYDKTDYAEAFFILPNESAFYIPDVGANKDSQAKFGSQEYYEANRIPAKRFQVPHVKFSGSGMLADYYVPAGRLIIVDRSPYNREWTASAHRGTSNKDESFPCQTSEGLNVTVEMAIATSVVEENAAKFLYRFGVNPPQGDRSKPEVIFTSIYYGRSLREVMDSVGRGQVQTLACSEISARTLDQANAQMPVMLKAITEKAKAWFEAYGITLDYIGWAGTFSFDPSVQKAINDRYEAEKIAPVLPTLQAQADIKVKEGLGAGLASKGLPASLVAIPANLLGAISDLFSGKPQTASAK